MTRLSSSLAGRLRGITVFAAAAIVVTASPAMTSAAQSCTCHEGGTLVSELVYLPYTILNAEAGDALVHRGGGGGSSASDLVSKILRDVGFTYTHSVLMTGDGDDGATQRVQHYVAQNANVRAMYDFWNKKLDANKLAHLGPGWIEQSFDELVRVYGLNLHNALVLEAVDRAAARRAAGVASSLRGTYRIQAYTSTAYRHHATPGTMCSGFVQWAWDVGNGGGISSKTYSPAWRRAAGGVLYPTFYAMAYADLSNDLPGVPIYGDAEDAADNIANQITNCFLDRGCDETDRVWANNPGSGLTVAPDDLLRRPGNTAYREHKAAQVIGGYYDDLTTCVLADGETYSPSCVYVDDGAGGPNTPPLATIATPPSVQRANVTVSYALTDREAHLASATMEYSTDGGRSWRKATPGAGSVPLTGLRTNPTAAIHHVFIWDSRYDGVGLPAVSYDVRLRLTPSDAAKGKSVSTRSFIVDNANVIPACSPGPYQKGYCGDTICDAELCENHITCNIDCGSCGDTICGRGETGDPSGSCATDCGYCGDDWCAPSEHPGNCHEDCSDECQNDCALCPDATAHIPLFWASASDVAVGEEVVFTADAERSDVSTATWAFGDGTTATGNPMPHVFDAPGIYQVVLTANESRCGLWRSSLAQAIVVGVEAPCDDCTVVCGDLVCAPQVEDCGVCPGDCPCASGLSCEGGQCVSAGPSCGDGLCTPHVEDCGVCLADCPCPEDTYCSGNACIGECTCPAGMHCQGTSCVYDLPVCGDEFCTPGSEDCGSCAGDCPCPGGTRCEQSRCVTYCGNGLCDAGENCGLCPSDCGCGEGLRCQNSVCIADSFEPCTYSGPCDGLPQGYCTNRCGCTCTTQVCSCEPPGPYCQEVCTTRVIDICGACP